MDNWMTLQMNKMTDELKAEIRKENMELKVLFNSFKVEELKAEVTKGNMELRAMITDLINANVRSESSGQKNTQRAYTTSDKEEDSQYMHYQGNTEDEQSVKNDSEQDSSDHSDIHEEEAKDDTIEIDDVEIEKEQKLTDGADNIEEMSHTQIVGPTEQNKRYEEDFTDDNDESKISLETCKLHYLTCREQLYEIINCQDISCKRDNHSRHHDFIANPLSIYKRERVTVGFGMNVIKQRAMEYVHDKLFNDILCNTGRDPKHPYTKPGHATISGMNNKQLNQTFNVYRLASQYLTYVLVKEMIIGIAIATNDSSYKIINSICQDTEQNLTTENRKRRKLSVYNE